MDGGRGTASFMPMSESRNYTVSATRSNAIVCRLMAAAQEKGTMLRTAGRSEGRRVELGGRMLYNFGTCSYLAFDRRAELRQAAATAAYDHGTQFSISRAYLECPLYVELEANLERMTGRPVVVAPSTTLAHLAALPAVVGDGDAVLIDQFAPASLYMATRLLRDIPVRRVRHNRLDLAERVLEELSERHERVWLLLDGLYSLFGDYAPFQGLAKLLARWPRLHLYIDDAHATGWCGEHGRGAALTHFARHERVLVALSLNKSFAAAGGALAVPDSATKLRIRRCGGPMLYSGPIPPPMLGAAVASSSLHLRAEHALTQARLLQRIDYTRTRAERAGLTFAVQHRTPIFFLPCDCVDEATNRVRALMQAGFYVCPSGFPAVPVNRPGVRFTITLHNELADIEALILTAAALAGARCAPSAAASIPLAVLGAT